MQMPRTERRKSASGIYHVMLRGINQQQIFEDEEDYLRFLSVLRECKEESEFKLYAYCMMGNHIHILLQEGKEPLEIIFKRIGCRFVYWYNLKYQRVGHLFQDRYKSEAVEDDAYFLMVLRYILQNPMKAGIEDQPGNYRWSSYGSYAGKQDGLTDPEMAIRMLGGRESLLQYLAEKNEDQMLDIVERRRGLTDEQAKTVMKRISDCDSVSAFQGLADKRQKEVLSSLLAEGLSVRQAARLTGVPKTTVARCAR